MLFRTLLTIPLALPHVIFIFHCSLVVQSFHFLGIFHLNTILGILYQSILSTGLSQLKPLAFYLKDRTHSTSFLMQFLIWPFALSVLMLQVSCAIPYDRFDMTIIETNLHFQINSQWTLASLVGHLFPPHWRSW